MMNAVADHAARFLVWMSQTTLQAGLLVCLILLVRALGARHLPARWHYALWLLLCFRILVPWAPESQFSLHRILPDLARSAPAQAVLGRQPAAAGQRTPKPLPAEPGPLALASGQSHQLTIRPTVAVISASRDDPLQRALFWTLGALWLLGALLLAGRVLCAHLRLWRSVRLQRVLTARPVGDLMEDCRKQLGISTTVRVIVTHAVNGPALFGCVRPRLLLPKGLLGSFSKRQMRHVFLHELAHLRRHDIALNWIVAFCQILHWFNPLVWLGFHLMRADREVACDQVALSQLKPRQTRYYGLTIIRLLEHHVHLQRLAALASMSQDPSQLKRRIRTIAQFKSYAERLQIGPVLITVLLVIMGLTNAQSPQNKTVWAKQDMSTPLYPPAPLSKPDTAQQQPMPRLGSTANTEEPAPVTGNAQRQVDPAEPPVESVSHSDVHTGESPPPVQEQTEIHSGSPSDGHASAQTWGVVGGGMIETHGRFNDAVPQTEIRGQGRSPNARPQRSSQGFVKMFGGDMNGSVLGVLNARELGFGRPPKSATKMMQAMVAPTWPSFAQQIEFRLLLTSQFMHHSKTRTGGKIVQKNLAFLVNLSHCLCAALNANDQASLTLPDAYLQRLRHSLTSSATDAAQLTLARKHALRVAQFSQRLYHARDRGVGPGPQRLYQNLLEEWVTLKSVMAAGRAHPGH